MRKLPDRCIPRKLIAILEVARASKAGSARELAKDIEKARRTEFSFFKPSKSGLRRLGYSTRSSIGEKVRFAIELKILDDNASVSVESKDFASEKKAVVLFAEKARDLLSSKGTNLEEVNNKAVELLQRNPIELPTALKLFTECKPEALPFTWFRYCLSILLFEPDGALGASGRRIYLPRTGEHQIPGEIGS